MIAPKLRCARARRGSPDPGGLRTGDLRQCGEVRRLAPSASNMASRADPGHVRSYHTTSALRLGQSRSARFLSASSLQCISLRSLTPRPTHVNFEQMPAFGHPKATKNGGVAPRKAFVQTDFFVNKWCATFGAQIFRMSAVPAIIKRNVTTGFSHAVGIRDLAGKLRHLAGAWPTNSKSGSPLPHRLRCDPRCVHSG